MPPTIQEERTTEIFTDESDQCASRLPDSSRGLDLRAHVPLVVDLDGTLIRTDLLQESTIRLVKRKPWLLPSLLLWALRGRKYLKNRVFTEVLTEALIDTSVLPINQELLAWLREQKLQGRQLVLATASDRELASRVVQDLKLFDLVLGSTATRDLRGAEKVAAIKQYCGAEFDYAGNSRADQAVWKVSRQAILVNASRSVESTARRYARVSRVIAFPRDTLRSTIQPLRLYQWVKNLLIFVPVFTSHQWGNANILLKSLLAFLAFGLCASGTYVANDLLDLEEDRHHFTKKNRSIASGHCSIARAVVLSISCLLAGLTVGFFVGNGLLPMLLLYVVLTACYSLRLKKVSVVDVLTLALLYTLRVVAGHVLTGIVFSMWLLSFSFFLFLSLALSKRAAELSKLVNREGQSVLGRGYLLTDLQLIISAGICSGFVSSLVFALYLNSESVTLLYRRPAILWGILPALLYYILRVWIACGRGELDMDPIVYTAKSRSTYLIGALIVLLVVAATVRY